MKTVLIKKQIKKLPWKVFSECGETYRIKAKISYNDACGNGHNTFHITGEIEHKRGTRFYDDSCGRLDEEVSKHFPAFAHLQKWQGMNPDGPWAYISNTTYHAGNRDYDGLLKGEPDKNPRLIDTIVKFGNFPITYSGPSISPREFIEWLEECASENNQKWDFEVIGIDHHEHDVYGTKYTFGGFGDTWYDCPFENELEALNFLKALQNYPPSFEKVVTCWGKGKERELESARSSAIWPEATDEQLSLPQEELTKLLENRLPALIEEFQKDILAIGFVF